MWLDIILKKLSLCRRLRSLRSRMFNYLNKRRFSAVNPVVIDGGWPKVVCLGKISIGENCVFRSFRLRQCITVLDGGVLEIGRNVYINDGVNICASTHINIGNNTKIGDMVYIYDTDFHEVFPGAGIKKKPVSIGNNVWIGANSMILAGSAIGDHSVIAAGSIVSGSIPSRCLAAGVPAKVIKTFEAPDDWVRK